MLQSAQIKKTDKLLKENLRYKKKNPFKKMDIEPETTTYRQIEGFIRTACEREWDNPITKIVKYKRYYLAIPEKHFCTYCQDVHEEECVSFKISSKGMKQHCKECDYEAKVIPTSALLRKKLFPNESIKLGKAKNVVIKTIHYIL